MMALAELDVMPRLDKAHQSVLRATPPDFLDLSDIPKMRQKFIDAMAKIAKPPRPEGLEITDHRPSEDVMVRVYRPLGLEASAPALSQAPRTHDLTPGVAQTQALGGHLCDARLCAQEINAVPAVRAPCTERVNQVHAADTRFDRLALTIGGPKDAYTVGCHQVR